MKITGGCLCGGLRYVVQGPLSSLVDCHCIDCRRSSGAAYVTWGTVRRTGFELSAGTLRRIPHANRLRGFAACCGTPILFEEAADAETVDVTIASLDQPGLFAPEKAIWTEDRLPWVPLNPSLPAFPQRSAPVAS